MWRLKGNVGKFENQVRTLCETEGKKIQAICNCLVDDGTLIKGHIQKKTWQMCPGNDSVLKT